MTCNQNTKTQDTIIRIHIISWIHRMLALVVASTALQSQLPMGFTLPFTRLAFKHPRPLSCQRQRYQIWRRCRGTRLEFLSF